jgi:hypothetical protein
MKIFAIGFNKTGTNSLHELFVNAGIHAIHHKTPVLKNIDIYDAFSDGKHFNFKEYYEKYPDSVFILNTRPIYNWLVSRYKHAVVHKFKESWCWPVSDEKTNGWITDRETHYKNVLDFFVDKPTQLLVVNIEKRGWESVVSTFIQKPVINTHIHRNRREDKNTERMSLITQNVTNCLVKRGYTGKELLAKDIDITAYTYMTHL